MAENALRTPTTPLEISAHAAEINRSLPLPTEERLLECRGPSPDRTPFYRAGALPTLVFVETHNPEKPAVAGRAWMLAAVFLLAALMCAQGLVASRSGGRVFPLGWPLSFMPPEGFSPVGSPELPFEAILAYEGSVQGSPPFRVLTGVAPLHSRTVPELTAIQVWAQVQAMAPETQLIDFSPPKPTRLGGRQAWLYGDLATGGAVLRCAAVGDTLAFAAAVTPEGGREQAAKVFDEFCASLRIARGR